MTNDEFKAALAEFKFYLKPALYTVLSGNAEVFSEETKKEIVGKLMEADAQVQEIHDYQEKRNNILRKGMDKIENVYKGIKMRFQAEGRAEKIAETAEAEKIISNL